jgi:O-Antigen ligase
MSHVANRPRLDPRLITTAVIVAAALLAAVIVPAQPGAAQLVLVLAAGLLGLGALVVFVRRPVVGLLAFVILDLVVPLSVSTGSKTGVPISVVLVALLIGLAVGEAVRRRKIGVPPPIVVAPLGALVVVASLAFLVGQLPWYPGLRHAPLSAQVGGLAVFYVSVGIFLLAAGRIQSLRWLRWLVWTFVGLTSLYVLGSLIPSVGEVTWKILPSGAAGSLTWTWLVALCLSQAVHNPELGRWPRALMLGLVAATFYSSVFQGGAWASGWIPALVAVLVVLWLVMPRLGLILTLAGLILAALNFETFLNLLLKGNEYSYVTRLEAWRILLTMVRVNPLLGLGPSNYYWYAPEFPILGFAVRFSSHNNYVDLIAQTGYLGLMCFLWFAAAMAVFIRRIIDRVPVGFARAYACGALAGLAGTLVAGMLGDWFLPFVYNIGLAGMSASLWAWLFLGGAVALGRIGRGPEEAKDPRDSSGVARRRSTAPDWPSPKGMAGTDVASAPRGWIPP